MRTKDLLKRAWKNLYKNKHRSALTILAASIGTASIITMVSVTGSIEKKVINKYIEDANLLKIVANSKDYNGMNVKESLQRIEIVRKIKGVKSAALVGTLEYEGAAIQENTKINAQIVAVDMKTLRNTTKLLKAGNVVNNENEALVSSNFFTDAADINKREWKITFIDSSNHNKSTEVPIHISGTFMDEKPYLVENIYKNREGKYPPIIYITMEKMNEINNKSFFTKIREFHIQVNDINSMDYVLKQLENNNFQVQSAYERVKDIKLFFLIIQIILGILGGITLIISAIGTANTMNMSMMERRKEIGIFKAIGTKISTIKIMFVIEAAYIGALGAALGIVFSLIFSLIINEIFRNNIPYEIFELNKLSTIPIGTIILVSIITITINILASASAVNNAVRVDTITVLREE